MKAILETGETIECAKYKLRESGVILRDSDNQRIAYVPHDMLSLIAPDEFEFNESDSPRVSRS